MTCTIGNEKGSGEVGEVRRDFGTFGRRRGLLL